MSNDKRKCWEYFRVIGPTNKELDDLGNQGWELVDTQQSNIGRAPIEDWQIMHELTGKELDDYMSGSSLIFHFKRER